MAVAAAHIIIRVCVRRALRGTVLLHLIAARALLRNAKRHRHLKHMSAAVGRTHFARTRIDATVRAAGRPCYPPARLPAGSRRLTVLAARSNLRGG